MSIYGNECHHGNYGHCQDCDAETERQLDKQSATILEQQKDIDVCRELVELLLEANSDIVARNNEGPSLREWIAITSAAFKAKKALSNKHVAEPFRTILNNAQVEHPTPEPAGADPLPSALEPVSLQGHHDKYCVVPGCEWTVNEGEYLLDSPTAEEDDGSKDGEGVR